MMQQYPKRLIEVDLPIKRISAHARREKSIRHGHISTLHIWWARRPLAACRAVICAALWPDPADPLCPDAFKEKVRAWMLEWAKEHVLLLSGESFPRFVAIEKKPALLDDDAELRRALLDFIADFADWDNSTNETYLQTARDLTQSAHEALGGVPGTRPLVVDPFAGGGAIPLEALRVGADAFASDLNPVAVLLNKVVLEYIPKYGEKLAREVRKWGAWIKQQAEKELAGFYPKDEDGAIPIAYLWARTIQCEGPGCGAEVPLMRSLWLAKKRGRSFALKMIPNPAAKRVDFEIMENPAPSQVQGGTVRRGSATCPCCGYTTPVTSVRKQLKARRGGAHDARLFAVVTTRPGVQGRFYRLPTERDLQAAKSAVGELERRKSAHRGELSLVPDEVYPDETAAGALSSSVSYGPQVWGDIFSPRQALALTTLVRLTMEAGEKLRAEHTPGFAESVQSCLAAVVDRQANTLTSLSRWNTAGEKIEGVFARQALPMVWDFGEANSFSNATGCFDGALNWVAEVCESECQAITTGGHAEQASATHHPLPDDAAQGFFTDPPYYDAIAYADLSDFFYVWLRRTMDICHQSLFTGELTDKADEIVQLSKRYRGKYAHKTEQFFESRMSEAMAEGRRVLAPDGIGVVVFAHKSTAGWESQLQAMVDAGWVITGSWPIDTEMGSRMNAMGTASLASSVHLICRPRENPDGSVRTDDIGDWRDVLAELPKRIHAWMPRLAEEGVVGADAIFACLGPALEIFSRYSKVEKASGEVVTLKEYLEHVWAAVSREALNMVFAGADATGFEEDARLTAMWLWTLGANANGNGTEESDEVVASTGYELEYDAARKIAQGLGAHLENLSSLVEVKGDKARLLPVAERTRHLFGKESEPAAQAKRMKKAQPNLFAEMDEVEHSSGWVAHGAPRAGATVLDRVHQSMILFATGRGEALKRFLVEEGIGRDAHFWKLAQALSALYPAHTDEKRWVDGVLARKKGLGF